jgi:hypothetical protein
MKPNLITKRIRQMAAGAAAGLFFSLPSYGQLTVQVGTDPILSTEFPIRTCESFNYSQVIYTAEQLNEGGFPLGASTITHIRFNIVGFPDDATSWNQWRVFMTNTTSASFTEPYGWVDVASLTEVFDGTIAATGPGWFEIALTTPFEWNGTDNLVVGFSENIEGQSCSAFFQASETGMDQSMVYSRFDTEIDPSDPTGGEPWECFISPIIPNIKFTIIPSTPCDGEANAGEITGPAGVCENASFNLIAEGASYGEGITGQWQSAPAATGPWTSISGATAADMIFSDGISEPTFFRYYVTCASSSSSDTSEAFSISINALIDCYCEPAPFFGCGPSINDVITTGGVDNINNLGTGCGDGGFSYYPEQIISAYRGAIYGLQITTTPSTFQSGKVKVWVDWNQDGLFSDDEIVFTSDSFIEPETTVTMSGEVPLSAPLGDTRMRIRILSEDEFDACGFLDRNSEAEDYIFTVLEPDPCDEVTAGSVSIDGPESICFLHEFTVSSSGTPIASGISRLWQYRTPSETGTWVNIDDVETMTYVSAGITEATDFRYIVTCEATGNSDTSNVWTVSMNNPLDCYCVPAYIEGCEFGAAITHVILGDIDNNTEGECSMDPRGFSDYNELSTDLMQGVTYVANVAAIDGFDVAYAFWIDFNDDGFYDDESERVATIMSVPGTVAGDLNGVEMFIADDAPLGPHRLRIRMSAFADGFRLDPCELEWSGETEEYTVNIVPKPSCATISLPTEASAMALPAQRCDAGQILVTLTNPMPISTGLTYQWSTADALEGAYANIGTASESPVLSHEITTTAFFKCAVFCEGELVLNTEPIKVDIVSPDLLEANDGSNCGPGTVTLTASANEDGFVRWYDSPTAAMPIAEGSTFVTPVLTTNTPYYIVAAAGSGPATDTLGAGSFLNSMINQSISPFFHESAGYKHQYLVRGNELSAMGVQAGVIQSLGIFAAGGVGTDYNGFSIKMANTATNFMSASFVDADFTEVYSTPTYTTTFGVNVFEFDTPFEWDGLSNVIVQFCWSNDEEFGTTTDVRYHNTSFPSHYYASSNGATPEDVCTAPEIEGSLGAQRPNMIFNSFNGCETERTEVWANILPVPRQPFIANDTIACGDLEQSITLNAGNPGSSYSWTTGETTQTLQIFTSGSYGVTITNEEGCSLFDLINVTLNPRPEVDLGNDTTFCDGGVLILDAKNEGATFYWNDGSNLQTLAVEEAGTYRVLVENQYGCKAGDTINVGIEGVIPRIDGILVDNLATHTFSFEPLNPTNVGSYTWDFGDGTPTSDSEAPTHTFASSGSYTVTLTLESECGKFIHTTTISILGIDNPEIDNAIIALYPNPAHESATIENKGHANIEEVTVLNMLGQVMYSQKAMNNQKHHLDLSGYAAGIYTVRILTDKGFAVRKFEIVK